MERIRVEVGARDGTAGDSASMPQLPLARTRCSRLPVTRPAYKKNNNPSDIMPRGSPTLGRLFYCIFVGEWCYGKDYGGG